MSENKNEGGMSSSGAGEFFSWLSPRPFRVHLDWGIPGATAAAQRGDGVVIVDVLSFSSCVITAVHFGAEIVPCAWHDDPHDLAHALAAQVATKRRVGAPTGTFSLSPISFLALAPPTADAVSGAVSDTTPPRRSPVRIVLPSPNGSTCSHVAREAPFVLVGGLLNAAAVAAQVADFLAHDSTATVTVVACGERWPHSTVPATAAADLGPMPSVAFRPALEDFLGAGAILSALAGNVPIALFSPDARVASTAFTAMRADWVGLITECSSGRELIAKGFADDVAHASQLDAYPTVPRLHGPIFSAP